MLVKMSAVTMDHQSAKKSADVMVLKMAMMMVAP